MVSPRKIANRYHTALVILHWLAAVLILTLLPVGFYVAHIPNADPHKMVILELHMAAGMFLLAVMLVRFAVRETTARPARADSGHPVIDVIGSYAHYVNYIAAIATAGAGFAFALSARLNVIVFQRSGEPLPDRFGDFPLFWVHIKLAATLAFLVAIHIGAAIWHQAFLKNHILRRLGFGTRIVGATDEAAGPVPREPRG